MNLIPEDETPYDRQIKVLNKAIEVLQKRRAALCEIVYQRRLDADEAARSGVSGNA